MADNSSRKFKFISPGVFIDEIDNSQLPATPAGVGPVHFGERFEGRLMDGEREIVTAAWTSL